MVLAATAVPIELRPLGSATLNFGIFVTDILANIAGYVPVGLVLAALGPGRALLTAVLMATLAEAGQFVMMHRDPSVVDVVANTLGASVGIAISQRFRIQSLGFSLSRRKALVAAVLACALILGERAMWGYVPSSRGTTSAGTLEAHWKFDESGGTVAFDFSGHSLNGSFKNKPVRIDGVLGRAVKLDGAKDSIDVGRSSALRLVGSMTISAWISPSSFPVDDAAIVSSHNGLGYQLDTTVDKGPRTIGFKLGNECGALMARYGATPLVVGTWYHVAGVYRADARTLDVYLNGELDNGFLVGAVTGGQRSSREKTYVGRRSNLQGYEFAGSIDDVRIYSRALTKAEITAVMRGAVVDNVDVVQRDQENAGNPSRRAEQPAACATQSDYEDSQLPGAASVLGVFVAVAIAGIWPSRRWVSRLVICLAAGLLLLPGPTSTLPALGRWLIVVSSLAGGASVVAGSRDVHRDFELPLRS